jgi:aryl-alcohol dehydrogenase-like predicted oxidoreductase
MPSVSCGESNINWWAGEQTSGTVINHALDLGINFIDTVDAYDHGRSGEFIGRTAKSKRSSAISRIEYLPY